MAAWAWAAEAVVASRRSAALALADTAAADRPLTAAVRIVVVAAEEEVPAHTGAAAAADRTEADHHRVAWDVQAMALDRTIFHVREPISVPRLSFLVTIYNVKSLLLSFQ